jgi:hypothetical protein
MALTPQAEARPTSIRRYIDACNTRAKPFLWTKTADQVLAHARPARS